MWNEDSLLKDIVEATKWPDEDKDDAKKLIKKNLIGTLKDWMRLTPQQKEKYPDGLVNLLDEIAVASRQGMLLFLSFPPLLTPLFYACNNLYRSN